MEKPNIYQRLNSVMAECSGYLQKDSKLQQGKGISHDKVTGYLRPLLIKHGIVIRTALIRDNVEQFDTKNDKIKIRYEGLYSINFTNIDDPDDVCECIMPGHGDDFGDKAPGKATSYAVKSAMLKTLSLETGENEEIVAEEVIDMITVDQQSQLQNLIRRYGSTEESFIKIKIAPKFPGVTRLSQLNKPQYLCALKGLERAVENKMKETKDKENATG